MKIILFQGDSITDAWRIRSDEMRKGAGYATMVSANLGFNRPGEFEFINRGISGDRLVEVIARVKRDAINLAPDYMSILIGVNDVLRDIRRGYGLDLKRYEIYYNMYIEQIKEALPNIKIMILEPFILKGSATEESWEKFRTNVEEIAQVAKRVAEKNDLLFVPLQEKFDEASKIAPSSYWSYDGIHPRAAGHELIKRAWLKGFEKLEK